jgi:hypothetical protein
MGSKQTKENLLSQQHQTPPSINSTFQTMVKSSSSDSIAFEELEPKQEQDINKTIVSDLYNKLNQFESELQKSKDTVIRLNHTIESLTNQVNILGENINQTYNNESSSSASIQTQLYGLEQTFTTNATSFDKGIKTLNYIVHTLIQNESVLVKYIDKLVSVVNIYDQQNKQYEGKKDDDEEDYEEDVEEEEDADEEEEDDYQEDDDNY